MLSAEIKEAEHLSRQLHALTEIAKTLTSPLELPELLDAVMYRIVGVLEPAEVGVIMLWDQSSGLFRPEACFGFNKKIMKEMGLRAGESVTGKVFDDGKARMIRTPAEVAEMMADMRPANRKVNTRALGTEALPKCTIAAPLTVGEQKYGVLVLETLKGPAEFEQTDLPFVQTIADLIALAIDRARLEAKADAIRSARQADRLRSEVMATLSHQLRMPLSAIKGYTTALMLDDIPWSEAKRKEFLQLVDEETDSMQSMIKELLDSSLIDVGQMSLELQPIRLPYMARDIAADFQRRYEKHRIIVDFPSDFPILEIDPRWMKQVFRNVLDNAMKYSPDGGLIVVRGEIRQNVVVMGVSDQGIGISPEDLIPLFERYFRGRSHNGFRVPGTGLGLPVARAIVEAHGGRIWAESKLGQGTTIYFSIPRPLIDLAVEE
jgi:K+-sensing histidine kinase KdpD